ncbi:hypothetical protein O181_128685 [Austropuccinia psidii MF-1]|uniref:Uncharacterized protein n=1 Tax=Austropuccinia psidii MF-1 TaxID=1389203 RepID=A0A9Q3L0N0_9BASI|nr:hypothetical protein [Austropuccinia psidii MF-1]
MVPFNEFKIQTCAILKARTNSICTPLQIHNHPSPRERTSAISPIMRWWEVIKPTSHNAPAFANCGHKCLTQFASCQSTFNGAWSHASIQR